MNRLVAAASLALLLVGCGTAGRVPEPTLQDRDLARASRLARVAFDAGRYAQATALYREAATYAEGRDDALALADAHYGAGVSLLRQGEEVAALEEVRAAHAALALVAADTFPELLLLEATLSYRLGQPERVLALADTLRSAPPPVAGRALFLSGLVAADRGDALALAGVRARLDALALAELAPDRLELEGRQQLLGGHPGEAAAAFEQSAAGRRAQLDYPGMARALAAAGAAREQAGELVRAAELYLRAGRSAAARDEAPARGWLARAEALAERAGDSAVAREARQHLGALEAASGS